MHWSEDLQREFRRERRLNIMRYVAMLCVLTALLFCFGWLLTACTTQKPAAAVPQQVITINQTITNISGDNNRVAAKQDAAPEVSAHAEASAEATTKSGAWIVWLALIALACGGGYWAYRKWGNK